MSLIEIKIYKEFTVALLVCLLLERQEEVADTIRGKGGLAKDAHDLKHRPANLEVMLDDGNKTIGDDGDVYLDSDGILRLAPETLDLKMLLDPLEKQLHLPPIFIKEGNIFGLEHEVVRVVDEAAVQLRSIIDDSPECTGVLLLVLLLCEADALVSEHVVSTVQQVLTVDNLVCGLAFLPDDEESSVHMNLIETGQIKISPVEHIAGKSLVGEPIHSIDVMHLGIGDSVEHGDFGDDVNLRVDFDARLGASELCPLEHSHAQVDGRRVDCIEPAVQFELLGDALSLGNAHHVESELLEDAMVSEGVGLRQYLLCDRLSAETEVKGLLTMGNCDVCKLPETAAAHQLAEHQNQHMVPMRHRPVVGPVVVLGDDAPELPLWEKLDDLGEHELSYMHICSDLKTDAKVHISVLRPTEVHFQVQIQDKLT